MYDDARKFANGWNGGRYASRVAVEKTDHPHSDVLGRFLEALVMSGSELHVAMIGAGTAKGDGD